MNADFIRAKHRQAVALMPAHGIDTWLVQFGRETGLRADPLGYLVGSTITWPSAFLLDRSGRSCAIVGSGDSGTVRDTGVWDEVRAYRNSPKEDLLDVLAAWKPGSIGVTWDASDNTADGITFGMYRMFESLLEGTRFRDALVSAGPLAGELRRRKLPEEVAGIQHAIDLTEELIEWIEAQLKPGISEIELQRRVHARVREAGHTFSWDEDGNPMVNFGSPAFMGHALPTERPLAPGDVVHLDIGLIVDGFASDIQRTWYHLRAGEESAPADVQRTFDAVRAAMDAGMAALKPGARGHEVDAASRASVEEWDFEEPGFAFGHHVGRVAHDGGGVLGPLWERYGDAPNQVIEAGNVFAVEMDLEVPEKGGLIGLEEEALVTETGAVYLSRPQRELRLLR